VPRYTRFKKSRIKKIDWVSAPDIQQRINRLVTSLGLSWVKKSQVYGFRSTNSKTRACARIWGLPRIWQKALKQNPGYIIEVISEKFDKIKESEKEKVLLHELCHIPKTFSGALFPHRRKGTGNFQDKLRKMMENYRKINK